MMVLTLTLTHNHRERGNRAQQVDLSEDIEDTGWANANLTHRTAKKHGTFS